MIKSFPLPEPYNIGGCQDFKFIPANQFPSILIPANLEVNTAISIPNPHRWLFGYATYNTLLFEEKQEESLSGYLFLTSITGFYPKITPSILSQLHLMTKEHFIVLLTDRNGITRLCGTKDNPLIFTFHQTSGTAVSDRPGISFTFSAEQIHPSAIYNPQ